MKLSGPSTMPSRPSLALQTPECHLGPLVCLQRGLTKFRNKFQYEDPRLRTKLSLFYVLLLRLFTSRENIWFAQSSVQPGWLMKVWFGQHWEENWVLPGLDCSALLEFGFGWAQFWLGGMFSAPTAEELQSIITEDVAPNSMSHGHEIP